MRATPTSTSDAFDQPGEDGCGRVVLAASGVDQPFARLILGSLGPWARPPTAVILAMGDGRTVVPRSATRIRETIGASWVVPLPLARGRVGTSWGAVAIGRSSVVVMTADRASDAGRALSGHPFWDAATGRLAEGGDVVAFGPVAAALGTTGADGGRRVDGVGLLAFDVAVGDPADAPHSGLAISRCAAIGPTRPLLLLDGNAVIRHDAGRWHVAGNEAVHVRVDGRWRGFDPGGVIPLPAPMVAHSRPFVGTDQLEKPA